MFRTTNEAIDLLNKNYRQVVRISFDGTQETIALTETNIIQGGFSISRASVSGERLEIGAAVSSELKIQLDNRDGKFDNTIFEGAELHVEIGVMKWDAHQWEKAVMQWIPCGYFTVDEPPRTLRTISLSALDRMVKFDRIVDNSRIQFPISISDLVNRCCSICGVTLASGQLEDLPNLNYLVLEMPFTEQAITYRNLIKWTAAIMGTCAYIDWDGKLRFQWYADCAQTIDGSKRYSSDMQEQDVTITGIAFTDLEKNQFLAGTNDYALDMTGNYLIQHDAQQVVNAIYQRIGGFTYRPYTAVIKPSPYFFPLDTVDYVDKNGESHVGVITNVVTTINGNTKIDGKGETTQTSGYAVSNGITAAQSVILERMKKATDKQLDSREQAVLELNEIIANSLGLYRTLVTGENFDVKYYYHNAKTLDESTVIYTFNEGGFAITDDWNDGNPTWQYGLSRDGNAVINALSAYKVTADLIAVDYTNGILSSASSATDAKLSGYSTTEEMNTAIILSASGISASIAETYETKSEAATLLSTAQTYADDKASVAEAAAKADTASKLESYYTKTEADAQMSLTLEGFRTTVSQTYETKSEAATLLSTAQTYADDKASVAEAAAKADTQTRLTAYYTKTETDSAISQSAQDILLSVSETYETQSVVAQVKNATIVGDVLHYLATSAGSNVTKNTSGWTTGTQSVTTTNKYLWTYHTYTYGDGHTSDTDPVITGVYGDQGQTGPAGDTGPQGATGTGVSEVIPLYYASSSSTVPSAPTANVTYTGTATDRWTRGIPALSSIYPYLYTCDQVKYSNSTYTWTTVVLDNAMSNLSARMNTAELNLQADSITSKVTQVLNGTGSTKENLKQSIVAQTADAIRLQTGTLTWTANNSSLDANGNLTVGAARITDNWSGVTDGTGLILGRAAITGLSEGNTRFSITMPYYSAIPIKSYVDYSTVSEEGDVVTEIVDPPVEELTDVDLSMMDTCYYDSSVSISASGYCLTLGIGNSPVIKLGTDRSAYFNFTSLYLMQSGTGYRAVNGSLSSIYNNRSNYTVINGIICENI